MLMNACAVTGIGILLTACAANHDLATLSDGACKAFPSPQYQIKGKTAYDQKWADETTEAGVAGCHWQRPAKRPAALDPMPVKAHVVKSEPWPEPQAAPKKPSLIQRLRSRFHKKH